MALDQVPRLYVEGKDDENVVVQLLMRHEVFAHSQHGPSLSRDLVPSVQVIVEYAQSHAASSGSKGELLEAIGQRMKQPKTSVGFIIDADDLAYTDWNLERTWQSVRYHLAQPPSTVVTPDVIPVGGFVGAHSATGTRIGVWLMPDNQRDGTIEHFLRDLVDAEKPLLPYAESCTRIAKDDHLAPFAEKDFQKAVLASWLAWQNPPGLPYGTALKRQCFQHDADLAQRFVAWVKLLIGPTT